MDTLPLTQHTLFADLQQRCLDAMFDAQLPENGSFSQRHQNGRSYWYYLGYAAGADGTARRYSKYVGPVDDPAVTQRVASFGQAKIGYRERRDLVRALHTLGLPAPPPVVGDVMEALWKNGFFRLRGVLVGTIAFQTYAGLLGVRLPEAHLATSDLDVAQFHSISMLVEDSMPPILDVLRGVDATFREVPHPADSCGGVAFVNARQFRVEFLTPNRTGDAATGAASRMPALGGASAQPLRYLDFLIYRPVRSVLLHKGGVPVTVPAPARYAIHKLIVAMLRRDDPASAAKARKDVHQAAALIEALGLASQADSLGDAWIEPAGRPRPASSGDRRTSGRGGGAGLRRDGGFARGPWHRRPHHAVAESRRRRGRVKVCSHPRSRAPSCLSPLPSSISAPPCSTPTARCSTCIRPCSATPLRWARRRRPCRRRGGRSSSNTPGCSL
ncbi:nucleotidyltransferase family protein [Methylobacterium oryzisoli]|uniref:nucleotidyltransferase family protein n=1 Tax=Methylobacterium oryzisoli TaxID=3385502 RepID=UPI0038920663